MRTTSRTDLASTYAAVRARTEALADPLGPEDQQIQSMPDVSPTKWHRAHTTWFFETFLLSEVEGYEAFDPSFGYFFNSYYETVGARHPRAERGLISRPTAAEVAAYRHHVDGAMAGFLAGIDNRTLVELVELGIQHEQQHQELLLMDIKHVLASNPVRPSYRQPAAARTAARPDALRWVDIEGGRVGIGHEGSGFCFDNELPRHDTLLADYALGDRLITCGEWLSFMADRGYERPTLWLSEGWHTVQSEGWHAPLYWFSVDGSWQVFTLDGGRPIDPAEPVCHISLYEADAFARWAGARLPTEVEWEHAASTTPATGDGLLHDLGDPLHPEGAGSGPGLRQLFGHCWEWTASAYQPYPGFAPASGAVGEYNGKFMINQSVLRGGCCVTPADHLRPTYRNFFPAHARWMFSGVRLARSA